MTITFRTGSTRFSGDLTVVDEAAFMLDAELTPAMTNPTLWVDGNVRVTAVAKDWVAGIQFGLSWPDNQAWVVISTTGTLTVTADVPSGKAYGFYASDWSQDFENRGVLTVRGRAEAIGVHTDDYGYFYGNNFGVMSVQATEGRAIGFEADEIGSRHSGTLEVYGRDSAVGIAGYEFVWLENSGSIRAIDGSATNDSVALLWGNGELRNTGRIEADVALRMGDAGDNDFQIVMNSGSLIGRIEIAGRASLNNTGLIQGSVTFGARDDYYDGVDGVLTGPLRTGSGADRVWGGAGAESLSGEIGADTIDGGAGDDLISGGRDGDLLSGGAGFDTLDYSDATMTVTLSFATGRATSSGEDTISGFEAVRGGGYADSLTGAAGADSFTGGGGDDALYGGAGGDSLEGGAGRDFLRGEDGADTILGGAEFDDLHGNMGEDLVRGGDGDDWVVGGQGNDVLYGDAGIDIVYGNLGNDTCEGGAGADLIRGGQADDVLSGGADNDWLSGDRGSDTVSGGAGADIFHSFSEAGADVITDFKAAEGDRVQLDPGTVYVVDQVGADVVINMGNNNYVLLQNVQLSALPAGWLFLA